MMYNDNVINKLEDKLMNNLQTRAGGGTLGLNLSKDADLGSQNLGTLGSKGRQGAHESRNDFFGALGSKLSKDADLGLKNFNGASKARHLKSTLDAQHILPCHCEECVSTTSQSYS